jgi:aspartate aminotransferase-like enzyme
MSELREEGDIETTDNEIGEEGLKTIFKTENELTMPVSAPGSAGMETCFANLVEPGDKVVVCINGVFGMRMQENITRFGYSINNSNAVIIVCNLTQCFCI